MVFTRFIYSLFAFMSLGLFPLIGEASTNSYPKKSHIKKHSRAPGAPRLGPWIEEGWRREDWSHAPSVRNWGYSAPNGSDPASAQPIINTEYPWGYVSPYIRIGGKCIVNELNESPGGLVVRYQRILPLYYCR